MVLQHATPGIGGSGQTRPRQRPDVTRVIGISGTIALNVLMLMLLLAPLTHPQPASLPEPTPSLEWIEPKPARPDPPPPIPVEVVHPQTPVPVEVRPETPPALVEPMIVDHGTLPANPATDTTVIANASTRSSIEPGGPVAGTRLEYLEAPAPRYPRGMLFAGIEGTVVLQVLVGIDGHPLEVSIRQSSGHRELDEAARRQVLRRWRFHPAMQGGHAVQAIGIVPIEFNVGR